MTICSLPYSMMLATTPAPTVRPPSRMAKRSFSSIAIGTISVTSMAMLKNCALPFAKAAAPWAPAWWQASSSRAKNILSWPGSVPAMTITEGTQQALRVRVSRDLPGRARRCEAERRDHERPKHTNPAQGVRSPHPRCIDARDRQHGQAHRRAGARTHSAADQNREVHGQPLAPYRQEEPGAVRNAHP